MKIPVRMPAARTPCLVPSRPAYTAEFRANPFIGNVQAHHAVQGRLDRRLHNFDSPVWKGEDNKHEPHYADITTHLDYLGQINAPTRRIRGTRRMDIK